MKNVLHVICSYCKKIISQGDEHMPISHGICKECLAIQMALLDEMFID